MDDAQIERRRSNPPGVVNQPYLRVRFGKSTDDLPRTVVGFSVHDENLEPIRRIVLIQNAAQYRFDGLGLVADRQDHRNERG